MSSRLTCTAAAAFALRMRLHSPPSYLHSPLDCAPRRAVTVAATCAWWRQVALEGDLLVELNLCPIPLFATRAQNLPGFLPQRDSFLEWLAPRAQHVRTCILQAERWEVGLGMGFVARCSRPCPCELLANPGRETALHSVEPRSSNIALDRRSPFFLACWQAPPAPRLTPPAQAFLHAQDDGASHLLRVAVARLLGPHLRCLKLVSQGGGRATCAFLQQGEQLRELQVGCRGAQGWGFRLGRVGMRAGLWAGGVVIWRAQVQRLC